MAYIVVSFGRSGSLREAVGDEVLVVERMVMEERRDWGKTVFYRHRG